MGVEEDLYKHQGRAAIALGLTSLLNHSYAPNCTFIRHIDALMIELVALRDIAPGEERRICDDSAPAPAHRGDTHWAALHAVWRRSGRRCRVIHAGTTHLRHVRSRHADHLAA